MPDQALMTRRMRSGRLTGIDIRLKLLIPLHKSGGTIVRSIITFKYKWLASHYKYWWVNSPGSYPIIHHRFNFWQGFSRYWLVTVITALLAITLIGIVLRRASMIKATGSNAKGIRPPRHGNTFPDGSEDDPPLSRVGSRFVGCNRRFLLSYIVGRDRSWGSTLAPVSTTSYALPWERAITRDSHGKPLPLSSGRAAHQTGIFSDRKGTLIVSIVSGSKSCIHPDAVCEHKSARSHLTDDCW
jgi:hypothetical protein